MQVFVKFLTGKVITLDVHGDEKVESVKQKIKAVEGLEIAEQRLVYSGTALDNDRALDDYAIGKESTLYLILNASGIGSKVGAASSEIQITVKTSASDMILMKIDPNAKVSALKAQVAERTGVASTGQMLFHEAKKLNDGNTLAQEGVGEGSVVRLMMQAKGGEY